MQPTKKENLLNSSVFSENYTTNCITKDLIFNFYSLYFSQKKILCQENIQIEISDNKRNKNYIKDQKLFSKIFSKIKSLFKSNNSHSSNTVSTKEFSDLLQMSKMNILEDSQINTEFQSPGLSQVEILELFCLFQMDFHFTCKYCKYHKLLLKNILIKDILKKIIQSLKFIRDSLFKKLEILFGSEWRYYSLKGNS